MKIKELEQLTGLTAYTLRYYEKVGLLQDIIRDKNGAREYSETDVIWIKFLIKMKLTRMSLEDLKVYADSYYSGEKDRTVRMEILLKHKEKMIKELSDIEEVIKYIDYKYERFKNQKK